MNKKDKFCLKKFCLPKQYRQVATNRDAWPNFFYMGWRHLSKLTFGGGGGFEQTDPPLLAWRKKFKKTLN